ncbi:uncharacterized protein LOC119562600 [Drosophila subpulchrella]|uniref:uncharacterized protein LOC119562600 n=1 Tax=Drosophila subpulchrella TaxID=1486046 RepID=UPI0018A13F64|nr:uncharacterized protein LOC119562600 [Drosophila subpulchrella]
MQIEFEVISGRSCLLAFSKSLKSVGHPSLIFQARGNRSRRRQAADLAASEGGNVTLLIQAASVATRKLAKKRNNQDHQASTTTHKADTRVPILPVNKQPMPILHHRRHIDLTYS